MVEAANILSVSRQKILDLVHAGLLERRKERGIRRWLISLRSVEAYHEANGLTHNELVRRFLKLEERVAKLEELVAKTRPRPRGPVSVPNYDVEGVDDVFRQLNPKLSPT